jgi:hypothetical protein
VFWIYLAGAGLVAAGFADFPLVACHFSAFGLFTRGYGACWFAGGAVIGLLYDHSTAAATVFCTALELAALPLFLVVRSSLSGRAPR